MDVFFSFLIDCIKSAFYCWRVIQPHEKGVRTLCGKKPVALSPGLHWMWPVVGEIVVIPVVEQVQDIRSQSIMTKDGKKMALGLNIAYEVMDPVRAVYSVQDWDQSLGNEAIRIAGEYVLCHTAEECTADTMCKDLLRSIRKIATERWGLRILRVGRSDFTECRALRLMTETSTLKPTTTGTP